MAQQIFSSRKGNIKDDLGMRIANIFWEKNDIIQQQKQLELENLNKKNEQANVNEISKINEKYDWKILNNFGEEQDEYLKESHSYSDEIKILDVILKKMAQHQLKEEEETTEADIMQAEREEWQDLQRAYLKGNTLYLKKMAKVIGLDVLKRFGSLDRRRVISGKQTQEEFNLEVQDIYNNI